MDNHHLTSAIDWLQIGLGIYYLLGMIMNLGFASYQNRHRNRTQGRLWMFVACVFLFHALAYFFQAGWVLPDAIKNAVNAAMNPVSYFVLALSGLILVLFLGNLTAISLRSALACSGRLVPVGGEPACVHRRH